jgi:hypothetical protein
VRHRAVLVGLVIAPAIAIADDPAGLRSDGEVLARVGRFSEAIDKFKAADRIKPAAANACLIALAYTRRELWPQAEIFLEKCHQRANAGDPLPDWIHEADNQIAERVQSANVAPVEIVVSPGDAKVELTVSSFAPDESFAPRTIHLPPGHHVILAKAAGFADSSTAVDIADKSPQHIAIELHRPGEAPPPGPGLGAVPPPPTSRAPLYLIGAGVGLGAIGGALHLFWYKPVYDDLNNAQTRLQYDKREPDFAAPYWTVIGLYAAGGAAVVAGAIWKYTTAREAPAIAFQPASGGGILSIGWTR